MRWPNYEVGDRVTDEPNPWRNGAPVAGWRPKDAGTIEEFYSILGLRFARVHFDSGRRVSLAVARLFDVPREKE